METIWKDRRMYLLVTANIASSVGTGISGIAVPWFLIQQPGGEAVFGYLMLGMNMVSFLLSPVIGVWVDRFSRKWLLQVNQILGLTATLPLALWGWSTGSFAPWQLVVISASGTLYYNLHFPTQLALVQEMFDRSRYRILNSVLEVQSQVAAVISGGLGSILLEVMELQWILLVDAATFLFSLILISFLPYQRRVGQTEGPTQSGTWWGNLSDGFRYLWGKPGLTFFFLCTMLPFIGVMASNYLNPLYVVDILKANAAVMGLQEMLYAVGAVAAGFTIPWLARRLGSYRTLLVTVGLFALSTAFLAFIPVVGVFLTMKVIFGWGNAGTRVLRNTLIMEMVPNHIIGRVNSSFQAVGYILRILTLGLFTQTVPQLGAAWAYGILLLLMTGAWFGVAGSRKVVLGQTDPSQERIRKEV
ncbi:MFS transporter [Kroppenstedtia pulmonis]|uniref:MFS transporter n=1 Tax=Kroppenstedtia pulmonis TaxID=1380685 RepID=A0A7D4BV34_9BACL|nr:MFS transporter [Kroppenstedtia pulmonis]QKG83653.1 MFS transporter [Kroppenstedtia pulmonis]